MHVLVIGAGIGGLCLAHGLRRAGVSVAVYERDASASDWLAGYRIHVNARGSAALHECLPPHLRDTFVASAALPGAGLGFMTEQLRELMVLPFSADAGAGEHPINRGVLRAILLRDLPETVHFNKRLVEFQQDEQHVTAVFADGTSATGDVLVGADGSASRVRQQYLPHARVVDTGAVSVAGRLPVSDADLALLPPQLTGRMNSIMPARRSFMFVAPYLHPTPRSLRPDLPPDELPNHLFWATITARSAQPDLLRLDTPALHQRARAMVADWHPRLRDMVDRSDPASLLAIPLQTSEPVAPWPTTRVTVLGDAIHAMTPLQGLGANTALQDATNLVTALVSVTRGKTTVATALATYEADMRAYGFAAVRQSFEVTQAAISDSQIQRGVFKAMLRAAEAVPALKERMFAGNAQPNG